MIDSPAVSVAEREEAEERGEEFRVDIRVGDRAKEDGEGRGGGGGEKKEDK